MDTILTHGRQFTTEEQAMIWQKPASHIDSLEEERIAEEIALNWQDPEMKLMNILLEGDAGSGKTQLAKALSADLQLPYTKVTCFADMDKSDVFGALLPVIATDEVADQAVLEAIYATDSLEAVIQFLMTTYDLPHNAAKERFAELVDRLDDESTVEYKFYPSEIVRALEKGYLLEIQEPSVIRDASVLVALNSALEPNGSLNIPTGIVPRHPDCVVVVTTNRSYEGNRPLNESLRDRMQHAEKMNLPTLDTMVERAQGKTGYQNQPILSKMAEIITLLDTTAKANGIKGVAGMRSYLYWVNTVKQEQDPLDTIWPKVLYKISTDDAEIIILQEALDQSRLLVELRELWIGAATAIRTQQLTQGRLLSEEEAAERGVEATDTLVGESEEKETEESEPAGTPREQPEMEAERKEQAGASQQGEEVETNTAGTQAAPEEIKDEKLQKRELNREAREILKDSVHKKEGLIVHRPEATPADETEAAKFMREILPTVEQLSRKVLALLEKEERAGYQTGKYYGTRFNASKVAQGDYRYFDKKNPPNIQPSLALALRVDESGSMLRDDRITAAKRAALAVAEFAERVGIPFMLNGDTADLTAKEKTSIYSYKEFTEDYSGLPGKIMTMKPRQNNRDGAVLRVIAEKLARQQATTKLLISISDGQPKALPDYTGTKAREDIQEVLTDYERQGVLFLAAAVGEDKEQIRELYGENHFIDITDLETFPQQLMQLIARYL
ncbi:ATP-dependent protease ATP-binding subunit ClpX [Enterococcus canis]|uniref:ATP-dependent protease ATP-binding subunit ClpX n=1 Tax=Enterococcus canis TaxID=214095 RepID=A0A1L8RKE9_9ENTE|nr:AAA family ATPase [Enterococcus canis]OJG20227.1 ATP-dependent protease ATP-binding subunit ClpX [Enterococcus canis]